MSFLAPLFLIGAAAIALPIIFHLIRRSSRERVVFSSLMFLTSSPPQISKRSRLEHILLLLMRCIVLALLALAFARPFIRGPAALPPNSSAIHRTAVLIDTSASMRRENLWENARTKAIDHARNSKPADQFAAFVFDRQFRILLSFNEAASMSPPERAAALQTRLAGVEPTWFSTHFGNALVGAAEALIESGNKDTNDLTSAEVVLVSDMQSGARMDGLQGFEWPRRFAVVLDPLETDSTENASLQVLEDTTRIAGIATNLPVRLRVQNNSQSKKEQFEVTWSSGPKPVGEKLNIYVPAGQTRAATAPALAKDETADRLVLTGDAVTFDNTVFFVPPKASKINVAFFGTDSPTNANGELYYLKRAFEQTGSKNIHVFSGEELRGLKPADAALTVATEPLSPEQVTFVREVLALGRTLVVAPRDAATIRALQPFLNSPLETREADVRNYAMFGQIDFTHPLFSPFADARFSDFTKIHFWKYRSVEGLTNVIVPARFDNGDPAIAEFKAGPGRIVLLTSTWAPADSQLALSTKFLPLLFTLLEQSAELRSDQHQFTIGDTVPLPSHLLGSAGEKITLPDGTVENMGAGTNQFTGAAVPGIYSIKSSSLQTNAPSDEYRFAVNVDPAEGKLAPLTREDFLTLGVPVSSSVPTPTNPAAEAQKQQHLLDSELESRQRIWHILVFAAVLLVLLESLVAMRTSAPRPAQA
jgi:hypothetical protein